jgi:hypothetical protein
MVRTKKKWKLSLEDEKLKSIAVMVTITWDRLLAALKACHQMRFNVWWPPSNDSWFISSEGKLCYKVGCFNKAWTILYPKFHFLIEYNEFHFWASAPAQRAYVLWIIHMSACLYPPYCSLRWGIKVPMTIDALRSVKQKQVWWGLFIYDFANESHGLEVKPFLGTLQCIWWMPWLGRRWIDSNYIECR